MRNKIETKEEKFERVLKKAVDRAEKAYSETELTGRITRRIERTGKSIRRIASLVADTYKDNPEGLRDYFSFDKEYVTGVATAAYAMIKGDLKPIRDYHYGGLGATLSEHDEIVQVVPVDHNLSHYKNFIFKENQLWYSENSGEALKNSINEEMALKGSINKGCSLMYSHNFDDALQSSINSDKSLLFSVNNNNTLRGSENSGSSLMDSVNLGSSLMNSWNYDSSLKESTNRHQSLRGSRNFSKTLEKSHNYDEALHGYTYDNDTLRNADRLGNSCNPARHNEEW